MSGRFLPSTQVREMDKSRYGTPEWSEAWRFPNKGMLEQAMHDFALLDPRQCLVIGYDKDCEAAAEAAGCAFMFSNASKENPGVFEHWENLEKDEQLAKRKKIIGEVEKFARD